MNIFADIKNNEILLKSLEEEIKTRTSAVESLRSQYQEEIEKIKNLKDEENQALIGRSEAVKTINDFTVIRDKLADEIEELSYKRKTIIEDTNDEKSKIVEFIETEKKEVIKECNELEKEIEKNKIVKKELEQQISESKKYATSWAQKEGQIKDEMMQKFEELKKLESKISDETVNLELINEKYKTVSSICSDLEKSLIEKKKEVRNIEKTVQEKEQELAKISSRYTVLNNDLEGIENKLKDITKRERELVVAREQIKAYYEKAGIPFQL